MKELNEMDLLTCADKSIKSLKISNRDLISKYPEKFDWEYISKYEELSNHIFKKFGKYLNWMYVSKRTIPINERFIYKYRDQIDWNSIILYQKLSTKIIRNCKDKINWDVLSANRLFTEDELDEFKDYINWNNLILYNDISYIILQNYTEYINFKYLKETGKLKQSFIEFFNLDKDDKKSNIDMPYYMNVNTSSEKESLPYEFIEYIDWDKFSKNAKLTTEILIKYDLYLDWHAIAKRFFTDYVLDNKTNSELKNLVFNYFKIFNK